MTFLAPAFLVAAGGMALLVVALHFLVTRDPATVPLPTARFAPDRPVRARARALKLSEVLLLLCRTGIVLAAGAALAQPIPAPRRRPLARIIMADRSGSVADAAAVGDSAGKFLSPRDVVVPFDSGTAVGNLSAALVMALRTAASLRDDADSLEIAIVSAFTADEVDQATDSIRALWPGALRLVHVAARRDTAAPPALGFVGAPEDPLRYALPMARADPNADVRIVRGTPTGADSDWAGAARRALVLWAPSEGSAPDTVGAVSAGDVVVVAPFPRLHQGPLAGRAVARWLDGAPAAVETAHGAGCIRTVSIPVPSVGDLVLDPRFQNLVSRLTGRCGVAGHSVPLEESRLAVLAGPGKSPRVPVRSIARLREIRSPLMPWLLAGALVLGAGELLLRRRRTRDVPPEASR